MDYLFIIFREFEELIRKRKESFVEGFYMLRFFREGRERIYKKFGEEVVEVFVVENREVLIYEIVDMLYYFFVFLVYNDVFFGEVMVEFRRWWK